MLNKKNRLRLDKDFDNAFKQGQSFYNDVFGLKLAKNNLNEFRLGVLVGLKVSKRAIRRNRIKRQIREIVRLETPKLKTGYDLVVITLPKIVDKDFPEIKSLLLEGLKKLELYK